ncbi:MAG: type II secretion system protein [bacterium]|nr:type II secretion system protein [bacterium]
MSFSKKNKAFTLIELLVVVAIMAILTAIIITNLTQAKGKSRDAKRVSDLAQMQLALELFFDRCNRYPVVATVSGANIPAIGDTGNGCPTGITLQTFISQIPNPPTAGDYTYAVNNATTPVDYVLRAKLETNNAALTDDVNVTVHGTDCSETEVPSPVYYYCVVPR